MTIPHEHLFKAVREGSDIKRCIFLTCDAYRNDSDSEVFENAQALDTITRGYCDHCGSKKTHWMRPVA